MAGEVLEPALNRGWLYHPEFPAHWHRRSLYSLATWVNGIAFKDIQFAPTGRPVIKIAEIKGGISGQTKFTRQTFDESVFVRAGDLLFSWSGQPETSIDAFWWRGPAGWLNQHVFRVTPTDGIDKVFLYYLLRYLKPNFVGIARNKQTTGLGHVTKRDMENMEVAHPDLPEQRAIAHILGTLDDKIELNRRMSATLEAMARALFKAWFVDFEPVRAKAEGRWRKGESLPGLPAHLHDLFPDRLVETEEGMIPEGWRQAPLDQIADFLNGLALQKYPGIGEADLPVIKIAELRAGSASGSERASRAIPPQYVVEDGDVLFSWSGSLLQRIWIGGRGALNQHLFKVTSREWPKWLHYFWVDHHLPRFQAIAASKATTMGHIQRHHLSEAITVIGPPDVMKGADERIAPLFRRSLTNSLEARTLSTVRDALLPKLLVGELSIHEAERFLERVS
ncbi:MAG: restriction endonuclease subunit S [Hyphomicrobium sp.]|jgi:type I restriction enzyme S subunit